MSREGVRRPPKTATDARLAGVARAGAAWIRQVGPIEEIKQLNRSCALTRSVIGVFLTTEKSTSPNPGPR